MNYNTNVNNRLTLSSVNYTHFFEVPDYQGEKFKLFLDKRGINKSEAARLLGISRQGLYKYFETRNLSRETVNSILTTFKATEGEIFGSMEENKNILREDVDRSENYKVTKKQPRVEAEPLYHAADPNDWNNDGSKFEDLGNGFIRMRIKVVPQKAYAGYLRGFQDPEYFEDFKTTYVEVSKEHRGYYLSFEVKGDSMIPVDPAEFEHMALPGWKAVGRELPRHQWPYKLHTHRWDAWIIVHKYEGILIKNIIKHDTDKAEITIHSLNPNYEDEVLSLNDVEQIFSVVKYIVDK